MQGLLQRTADLLPQETKCKLAGGDCRGPSETNPPLVPDGREATVVVDIAAQLSGVGAWPKAAPLSGDPPEPQLLPQVS